MIAKVISFDEARLAREKSVFERIALDARRDAYKIELAMGPPQNEYAADSRATSAFDVWLERSGVDACGSLTVSEARGAYVVAHISAHGFDLTREEYLSAFTRVVERIGGLS